MKWVCPHLLYKILEKDYFLPFTLKPTITPKQLLLAGMFTAFSCGSYMSFSVASSQGHMTWHHSYFLNEITFSHSARELLKVPSQCYPRKLFLYHYIETKQKCIQQIYTYNKVRSFDMCPFISIFATV